MPPHRIQSLDDYWSWLEELIDRSGGYLEHGTLTVQPLYEDDPGAPSGFMVLNQYVHFWDGSSLKIRMTVNRDLELAKYGFHYMDANGEMIWRKDQHDDPAGTHGGEYHIHDTPNLPNKARAYPAVDLEEALQEVVDEVDTTQIEPQ